MTAAAPLQSEVLHGARSTFAGGAGSDEGGNMGVKMSGAVKEGERQPSHEQRLTKLNCWEFKKCGRQPQGAKVGELGLCRAASEDSLDGVHDGTNAGRCCWVVGGTLCKGEVQGTFAQKFRNCEQCDFYQLVRHEEQGGFRLSAVLLAIMRRRY